jgi:uncharacterized UBP type Zn finger protein
VSLKRWLADGTRRFVFQGSFERRECSHMGDASRSPVQASCEVCESAGMRWVHLRMCLACGAVGCCDSSTGRHARRHYNDTGHPAIRSIEPGEAWAWCYVHRAYASAMRTERPES